MLSFVAPMVRRPAEVKGKAEMAEGEDVMVEWNGQADCWR